MRYLALLLVSVLIMAPPAAWSAPPAAATGAATTVSAPENESEYVVGPGDILDVSVWKDEALTKEVVVLPDGKITFPLVGPLQAGGKTLNEIRQELETKIKPYVPEPTLSLSIRQVNSMLIYVIGRVNAPGRFALNTNVTVLQALAIAGGLNPFAKRDKVRIFRQAGGKKTIIPFKYDEVVEGKNVEQNIVLLRGDLVVVP